MPLPNAASLPPVDLAAWAQFDASPGYESARRRPASRIRSEGTAGAMPDRPTWLHRIPEILEWLRTEEAPPLLHRALVEKRFQLRRRQAIRVLHEAGASRAGRDSLVRKEDLALYLEARNGVEAAAAARQRALLAQRIEGARGTREARLLEARPAPVPQEESPSGLPPGVRRQGNSLEIRFQDPEDLMAKLAAIALFASEQAGRFRDLFSTAPSAAGKEARHP